MNGLLLSVILAFVAYILSIFIFGGKKKHFVVKEKQVIPISDIAMIWADGQRTGQLHIRDIAPLWRKSSITATEKSDYSFKYERVERWFSTHILNEPWFGQAEAHVEICFQILRMLEEEDPCPSVVNPANDVEASWDTNTYAMLGRTSLLDHTLHVGTFAADHLIEAKANHIIPDTMVAALAHDIGKLPSNRTHLYSLGEHPLAAGRRLADIDLFRQLSRRDEISRAIKLHHMKPEGLIGRTLKKADQKARQRELEIAVDDQTSQIQQEETEATVPPTQADAAEQMNEYSQSLPPSENSLVHHAQASIYGEDSIESHPGKQRERPKEINISGWFSAQQFIKELKPYINRVTNRKFQAFSMPNGYVYVQPKAIEEVARKLAEHAGEMEIVTMGKRDKSMQRVLFSIVEQFRAQDWIARDLVGDQYFGGYFSIRMKTGKLLKGYYTPFKAEAFGSIAEMEEDRRQKNILKNFSSIEVS